MLYGRAREQAELDALIARARSGVSGALVLRGDAGIGKSALLAYAAESAADTTVLRLTGIEAEADLAFAGMVQLLWPIQQRIDGLPTAQAEALHTVLGSGGTSEADRFFTGLATLTLFAELAEDGPVLCLIDDAQWLDKATTDALLFAARRLSAEGVAMLFAARDEGFSAPGVHELRPAPLGKPDAELVIGARGGTAASRARIVDEADGNPLALIEFAAAGPAQPDGAGPLPVADRVLASFRAKIAELPERARLMLMLTAAEGRGDLPTLLGAAGTLGVGLDDLREAEQAELVRVESGGATFRHPLIATASYRGAAADRIAAHRALAGASTDPDCRAAHLAASTIVPDEQIAAEIAAAAKRAKSRAAYVAAAGRFAQSARITSDPRLRATRLTEAAKVALIGGEPDKAGRLATEAEGLTDDAVVVASGALVRATVAFERGEGSRSAELLITRAAGLPPEQAAPMLRAAAGYAWFPGDATAIKTAAERLADLGVPDLMVDGMAELIAGDYRNGLPRLADFLAEARKSPDSGTRMRAIDAAVIVGDDAAVRALSAAEVAWSRERGRIAELPRLLQTQAYAQVLAGAHREAEASVAEAVRISDDTGLRNRITWLDGVLGRIAAIEGDESRCAQITGALDAASAPSVVALSLLDLGLGRYEQVLTRMEEAWFGNARHTATLIAATADQAEAAVRLGQPDRAEPPVHRFDEWASASGQPWARAVAMRCRALLSDEERDYTEAMRLHERDGRPFEQARTAMLYGEWLRRARRRSDARDQLHTALSTFERLRSAPWISRARSELRATGESAREAKATAANPFDRLTPQELQVVRLAADGGSSKEIAAQLFLSRRTVEHHLYRAYPKLGVGSRRELAALNLTADS